jgi:hypothetical protein
MAEHLTLDHLVDQLHDLRTADGDRLDKLAARVLRGAEEWHSVLRDIPFDRRSFDDRFQPGQWADMIQELRAWCLDFDQRPAAQRERYGQLLGFLGLFLLTLMGLTESSHRRTRVGVGGQPEATGGSDAGGVESHDCAGTCGWLVRQPEIRAVIREIYRPDGTAPERTSKAWAEQIDFETLEFHAHGTTSIILKGTTNEILGRLNPFALKLIIFPFLRISSIETATRDYMDTYDLAGRRVNHLVGLWASSSRWILMDLVEGRPLGEYWDSRMRRRREAERSSWVRRQVSRQSSGGSDRTVLLEDLRIYGEAAFQALAELDKILNPDPPVAGEPAPRRGHCDLTPSNIIVTERDGKPVFRLIDVGANYLYSFAFSGLEGADSRFVAPEVKEGKSTDRADLFSLGKLLIMFGGGEPDDVVPDEFYAQAPLLARFIEDLIDRDADRRQIVFPPRSGQRPYGQLQAAFEAELSAESARAAPTDNQWFRATWNLFQTRLTLGLFRPLAGAPGQLRRIYQARRSGLATTGHSARTDRALLGWSWLSSAAWAITFSITVTWIIRQTNWEWGNRTVEAVQRLLGGSAERFPLLDSMRAPDYVMPDLEANLPALVVGLTYAMVGAKYYQNLFAQMTPMVAGWRAGWLTVSAAVAQFFMRLETIVAASLVLPAVLVNPRWWPICSALGQTLVFFCNAAAILFARRALADARRRRLTTVPPSDSKVTGMASFAEWTPTSLFYAVVVWVIGWLIYEGTLKDTWVYALSVASINFFLFYLIKCGAGAAEIRVVLSRATLAAERLRHIAAREQDRTPAPAVLGQRRGDAGPPAAASAAPAANLVGSVSPEA